MIHLATGYYFNNRFTNDVIKASFIKARFPAFYARNSRNARFYATLLRKQRKVQYTPLIWRKPYHVTNSSHVIGHFLRTWRSLRSLRKTLRCLRYVRCVACVRLETALNYVCRGYVVSIVRSWCSSGCWSLFSGSVAVSEPLY